MKIYSVTEINSYIKLLFMKDNVLSGVKISGEISNCKYHTSGHIYFTLKDSGGQIACVMFAGKRAGLSFKLEEGLSVVVSGTVTVYERDGKYQLYADRIEQQGKGDLYERFEKLKEKLNAEGLFDSSHKKAIPAYIRTLGVITASTGAALQDIINITTRRNPYVNIILYPAKVQGIGAAQTLIEGIKAMERIHPDVIIIGRGGGSIEDLFEFNDEGLARTIYNCTIPVISAVGHEVDFTICDYVSDLRAPTPSAAAELAVFCYNDFESRLIDYHSDLLKALTNKITHERDKIERYKLRLSRLSPRAQLNNYKYRLETNSDKLSSTMKIKLSTAQNRLAVLAEQLEGKSPLQSLLRGYSYVKNSEGHNINTIKGINEGDSVTVVTADGHFDATVTDVTAD